MKDEDSLEAYTKLLGMFESMALYMMILPVMTATLQQEFTKESDPEKFFRLKAKMDDYLKECKDAEDTWEKIYRTIKAKSA